MSNDKILDRFLLHTETTIDSSHKLKGYDGNCKNLHGHTWRIRLWFDCPTIIRDGVGVAVDFKIVKELKKALDHTYINDVIGGNPTAENLSEWIYNFIRDIIEKDDPQEGETVKIKVRLYETAVGKETWCEYGDFR